MRTLCVWDQDLESLNIYRIQRTTYAVLIHHSWSRITSFMSAETLFSCPFITCLHHICTRAPTERDKLDYVESWKLVISVETGFQLNCNCISGWLSPFMSGDGSSTVSRELWKTMLMVRSTNTRRIRAPMLKRDQKRSQISDRRSPTFRYECYWWAVSYVLTLAPGCYH